MLTISVLSSNVFAWTHRYTEYIIVLPIFYHCHKMDQCPAKNSDITFRDSCHPTLKSVPEQHLISSEQRDLKSQYLTKLFASCSYKSVSGPHSLGYCPSCRTSRNRWSTEKETPQNSDSANQIFDLDMTHIPWSTSHLSGPITITRPPKTARKLGSPWTI